MADESYRNLCIFHVLDGLREGLSHFSQKSRAALVYATTPDAPVRVYDPQNLLSGHEPALRKAYLESGTWRENAKDAKEMSLFEQVQCEQLNLAGLLSHSSCSRSIYHQTWFSEHHPDICNTGPTKRWMEHAAWLLSQNFASENVLYVDTASSVLQGWCIHAIRNYIVDTRSERMGMDTRLRIYPILDAILTISKTPEEGVWPRGRIAFVEPSQMEEVDFLARFPEHERPRMEHPKHVRKVLQAVENATRALVSDGQTVVGIAGGNLPESRLMADFRGGHGFLYLGDEIICSFSDGNFHSTNRRANLVQLEEALLETDMDPADSHSLFRAVTALVQSSQDRRHGSTLVIDLNPAPDPIAGQHLEEPLNLERPHLLATAQSLAKVDGALHIGVDRHLHGFGCLLDGSAIWGEDRSRGARYNSALRFTAANENVLVVVVSSDRPVSIIQNGMELTATCLLPPKFACVDTPPPLEQWLEE